MYVERYEYFILILLKILQLLQCGYFALAILNDLVGSDEISPSKQTSLQKARDWLFSSIALPIAVVSKIL